MRAYVEYSVLRKKSNVLLSLALDGSLIDGDVLPPLRLFLFPRFKSTFDSSSVFLMPVTSSRLSMSALVRYDEITDGACPLRSRVSTVEFIFSSV